MDEQIDREFEQLAPQTPLTGEAVAVRRNSLFLLTLTFSLLLHLALIPLIYLPGKRTGSSLPSAISVDLSTIPSLSPSPPQPEPEPASTESAPPEPVTPPKPEPPPPPPATEAEELTQTVREAVAGGKEQPELLEQSSLGLGLSLGRFSTLAEGRTLRDDIKQYYFTLLRKVNEQWWLVGAGGIRTPTIPVLTVVIGPNGELLNRILEQSSGDREFDGKILRALDAAAPFPPLPQGYRDRQFTAPMRMVPPLNLLL